MGRGVYLASSWFLVKRSVFVIYSEYRITDKTMQHLILHIGRHKTGTTSLQYTLFQNRGALADADIYYPETGRDWVAQHEIATRISKMEESSCNPDEDKLISCLLEEIRSCGKGTVIISSEGFQRCNPSIVREVFKEFRISVAVYLRDQLSYLQSSYLQSIHAEKFHGTIEEYERDIFSCDYMSFLSSWQREMGCEHVIVRIFSKAFLKSGNVVTDFFHQVLADRLGITVDYSTEEHDRVVRNSSLTGDAIAFKKRLNAVLKNDRYYFTELYKALGVYSGGARGALNLISTELREKLQNKYCETNRSVLRSLSLPESLLDFPEPGPLQSIEWMEPSEFLGFLQMLIGIDEECGILLEDCYHVDLHKTGNAWQLEFCPNIQVDSLHLVKIRHGDTTRALDDVATRAANGYVMQGDLFDPSNDQLILDFGHGQPVTLHHSYSK